MHVLNGGADLAEQPHTIAKGKLPLCAVLVNTRALDEIHREKRQAVVSNSPIQELCDVRVIERCQNLALVTKPFQELSSSDSRLDYFDRNTLSERVIIPYGEIDSAHTTGADLPDNAVRTDSFPGRQFAGCRRYISGETLFRVVSSEQRFQFGT